MNNPKTVKCLLKILIQLSDLEIKSLKGLSKDGKDLEFFGCILADIQNNLGEDDCDTLKRNGITW